MAVRPCEEFDAVAEAVALHDGQAPLGLRGGQGGPEGGRGELALVAQVAFHEVDAAPEAAQPEAALLLVVAGATSYAQRRSACHGQGVGDAPRLIVSTASALRDTYRGSFEDPGVRKGGAKKNSYIFL